MARRIPLGIALASCISWGVFAAENPQSASGALLVEKENITEARLKGAPWLPADVGTKLAVSDKVRTGEFSRAAIRFTDLSVLRLDELTTIEVVRPTGSAGKGMLNVPRGSTYFFSREKANEIQLRTPAANGTLRGTEFALSVGPNGHTTLMLYEGEVELGNAQGRIALKSGEQGEVDIGKAPRKTAVIDAQNIIQWCLYYPGVVDPSEIPLAAADKARLSESLAAYRAGDLLGALAKLRGIRADGSDGVRLYRAAVMLSVGQVEKAHAELRGIKSNQPLRLALEQMIAAVQYKDWKRTADPRTASEWMAESYHRQSRGNLDSALAAARKATEAAPEFGFAWVRVAELLFSFGRIQDATKALDRGMRLSPRNAKAHALQGFLRAAENRIGAARTSFDEAIALDGALGDAWLGRGLTFIRAGHDEKGRADLQIAATLEPNRSILRSYLGKAFGETRNTAKASSELKRAIELDANDPTPWLYSAIQRKQENRYNEAVGDLETSVRLNDNRRVYRSQFLLDQDRAVRSTNLANIYLKEGMEEQSVREAVRAVGSDYGSASAHLFLANSYDALRDPTRVLLRYETAWFNELLLSNLLSPVGGSSLSQFVSQQEYSKLFEKDGVGFSSLFDYRSDGQLHETASQYGTHGNLSYAVDADYQYYRGARPNNSLTDQEYTATFKLQLGVADSLFFQARFADLRTGDVLQYYDPQSASSKVIQVDDGLGGTVSKTVPNQQNLTYHLHDEQSPGLLLLGWHHEWSPGNHTLLLLGRLASDQGVNMAQTPLQVVTREVGAIAPVGAAADLTFDGASFFFTPHFQKLRGLPGLGSVQDVGTDYFDLNYRSKIEIYSAELQQIATLGMQTFVFGARYQGGRIDTRTNLAYVRNDENAGVFGTNVEVFDASAPQRRDEVNFERLNLYLYDTWHIARWLSITGGVTYDAMRYPDNFRNPPTNGMQTSLDKVSPKVGVVIDPWRGATIRAAYAEAINGTSFDESVRLEPTQVSGFLQAYRSITSESLIGSVAGSNFRFSGLSFEQKLPTRTYFGMEYNRLEQNADQTIGAFDYLIVGGNIAGIEPSSLAVRDRYHEDVFTVTVNQLVWDSCAFGARYRYTRSKFDQESPALRDSVANAQYAEAVDHLAKSTRRDEAILHHLSLYGLYNHPSGFFGRAEANWYQQTADSLVSDGLLSTTDAFTGKVAPVVRATNKSSPKSDFWQFNVLAGYRFYRNQCEISCGVLNLTGQDYRLNPVNPYEELPRDRTFVVRCKLTF